MKAITQALMVAFEFCGQRMSDEVIAEMAKELSVYPEHEVLLALKRCRSELRAIKFADILDRLPGQHPGVEEAWAQVSRTMQNEQISICWTEEMRTAYGAAASLADDLVAARMAFKEVYARLVSEARVMRKIPSWSVSLGWDKTLRDECVREAEQKNLISRGCAAKLLAHEPHEQSERRSTWVSLGDVTKEVTHGLPTMPRSD